MAKSATADQLKVGFITNLIGLDQLDALLNPAHRHQDEHHGDVGNSGVEDARCMSHFDALGVTRLDVDMVCSSAKVAAKLLTISDRTSRHNLEVRVASVDKLLIHSITLVRVHDTCSVHFRVGEVL